MINRLKIVSGYFVGMCESDGLLKFLNAVLPPPGPCPVAVRHQWVMSSRTADLDQKQKSGAVLKPPAPPLTENQILNYKHSS